MILLVAALGLPVIVVLSGMSAALTFRAFRKRWKGSWLAEATSWAVLSWVALAIFLLSARVAAAMMDSSHFAIVRIRSLGTGTGLLAAVCAGALFGMLMAEAESTDERAPFFTSLGEDVGRGTLLKWLSAGIIGWVVFHVVGRREELLIPNNRLEAASILDDAFDEATRRPKHAHSQLVHGIALMELGRSNESIRVLKGAISMDAHLTHPRNAIGWMLNAQDRYAEAIPYLQEAVRIDDSYGNAWHNLGWALAQLQRFREAQVAYARAVELLPFTATAAVEYSGVLLMLRKHDKALAQVLRAVSLDPKHVGYRMRASFLLRTKGRFADARLHLEEVVKLNPRFAFAWADLGVTHYLMQDASAAAAAFAQAEQQDSMFFLRQPLMRAMFRSAKRGSTADVRPDTLESVVLIPRTR